MSMIAHSVALADHAEREQLQKECMKNLDAIGKAVLAYRDDHTGEMPDWISDLYPQYLENPKLLICPADKKGGVPAVFSAYKDPKMPCSYLYVFGPMEFVDSSGLHRLDPSKDYTFKELSIMSMKYFGNLLPMVRCHHHSRSPHRANTPVMNLGYDGKIYVSLGAWQYTSESNQLMLSSLQGIIAQKPASWGREISLEGIYKFFKICNRLTDFRALLEQASNLSVDALKILVEIYQFEGKIDKAIETYRIVIQKSPNDVETRLQLAKLYATRKNYSEARMEIKHILKLEPQNPKARGLLAELDAIEDANRIQHRFDNAGDVGDKISLHYLSRFQERLLSSEKNLSSTVSDTRKILEENLGESESATRLGHLYKILEKSLASYSERWQNYTTSDGLNDDEVDSVAQDNNGILWIGTGKGVCQYNGESFIPFNLNSKLHEAIIESILIDKRGHVWFGTRARGAFLYDGESVVNYTVKDGLAGNAVYEIVQDQEGFIWLACYGSGISRYDGNKFRNFTTADGLTANNVWTTMADSQGNIWIGTFRGGVSRYDGKTFVNLTEADGLLESIVLTIAEDSDGNLWFGTTKGVSKYDGSQFTNYTAENSFTDHTVYDILEDSEGNIWFATSVSGIFRYDGEIFINFTTQDGLASDSLTAVFEDREGNIWFGSYYGLNKLNPRGLKNYGVQDGLAGNAVYAIAEDGQGNLWIGSDGGINRYDGTDFTKPISDKGRIISILSDAKNNLWFGAGDRGLIRYNGADYTSFTALDGLVGNYIGFIKPMIEDRNGLLWIVSWNSGISQYDGKEFNNLTMMDGLPSDYVYSLAEDQYGNIWIGTWGNGIARYNGTDFTNFTVEDGLVNDNVISILSDTHGQIWLGTSNGLSKYDGTSFTTVSQFEGNFIWTILEDLNGHFWFGTSSGGIIKTDGKALMRITTADGLPHNEVYALCEDKDRNIWIGTREGLSRYTLNPASPLIHIESVMADKVYTAPKAISIPAGKNVRINYRGISFRTRPEAMQYLYQLERTDVERTASSFDDWQEPTNKRSVDYLNLKPGTYTFKVKVVDMDLNYSQPASLTLKVMPPFYLMGVFLAPTVSFGTILLATLIILTTSLIKRRREVRAYERAAVEELQDANRVQMMLMPDKAPPIEGLEIAGKCLPANTVSGDFFDYLVGKGDNQIGLVVADVCGKAMKGAMNTMMTDGILHSVAKDMEKLAPAFLMRGLNEVLKGRMEQYMNVTMVIGVIDTDANTLTIANAAHHAHPLLLCDGEIQTLKTGGLPLGMRAGIQYTEEQFELQSGDVLILMSDGIIEAKDSEENEYSESGRLEQTIGKFTLDLSSEAMVDAIINDAIDFGGDKTNRDDDMTVVVAKVK